MIGLMGKNIDDIKKLNNKIDYDSQKLSMEFPPEATARIDAMARFYGCEPGQLIAHAIAAMEQQYIKDAEAKKAAE